MTEPSHPIYIGTILLERNRWAPGREPTYRVSEWAERFRLAGFDGMELWEYHATHCSPRELAALEVVDFPVRVLSGYCDFDDESAEHRHVVTDLAWKTAAEAVKFNVGKDPALREQYLRNLRTWVDDLPAQCVPLCECHAGTIIEDPAAAAAFFDEARLRRFGIVVHPFNDTPERLAEWLDVLGQHVAHVHVQTRRDNAMIRLRENAEHVRGRLGMLKAAGFGGSFTLEFTGGTGGQDENVEELWQAALDDLDFLTRQLG